MVRTMVRSYSCIRIMPHLRKPTMSSSISTLPRRYMQGRLYRKLLLKRRLAHYPSSLQLNHKSSRNFGASIDRHNNLDLYAHHRIRAIHHDTSSGSSCTSADPISRRFLSSMSQNANISSLAEDQKSYENKRVRTIEFVDQMEEHLVEKLKDYYMYQDNDDVSSSIATPHYIQYITSTPLSLQNLNELLEHQKNTASQHHRPALKFDGSDDVATTTTIPNRNNSHLYSHVDAKTLIRNEALYTEICKSSARLIRALAGLRSFTLKRSNIQGANMNIDTDTNTNTDEQRITTNDSRASWGIHKKLEYQQRVLTDSTPDKMIDFAMRASLWVQMMECLHAERIGMMEHVRHHSSRGVLSLLKTMMLGGASDVERMDAICTAHTKEELCPHDELYILVIRSLLHSYTFRQNMDYGSVATTTTMFGGGANNVTHGRGSNWRDVSQSDDRSSKYSSSIGNNKKIVRECEKTFERMLEGYARGNIYAKPKLEIYHALLQGYARSGTWKAAKKAESLLNKLIDDSLREESAASSLKSAKTESSVKSEDDDIFFNDDTAKEDSDIVKPTMVSFYLTMKAYARLFGKVAAAEGCERLIRRLEDYSKTRGDTKIGLDTECCNILLRSFAASGYESFPQGAGRAINVLKKMQSNDASSRIKPDFYTYATILGVLVKTNEERHIKKAERILAEMEKEYIAGNIEAPDTLCYNRVIGGMVRKVRTVNEMADVENVLERMTRLENERSPPDYATFELLMKGWQKVATTSTYEPHLDCSKGSMSPKCAAHRAEKLLVRMERHYAGGNNMVKPDVAAYRYAALLSKSLHIYCPDAIISDAHCQFRNLLFLTDIY